MEIGEHKICSSDFGIARVQHEENDWYVIFLIDEEIGSGDIIARGKSEYECIFNAVKYLTFRIKENQSESQILHEKLDEVISEISKRIYFINKINDEPVPFPITQDGFDQENKFTGEYLCNGSVDIDKEKNKAFVTESSRM